MDFITSHRRLKKLPAVFPIVLYNGDRNWTAPERVEELIENQAILGEFGLHGRYFKIAENDYSREELLEIGNIVSTLFLAESHYDLDFLKGELLSLFSRAEDKKAVSLFLNWFKQLAEHGKKDQLDYKALETVYQGRGRGERHVSYSR